MSYDAGLAERVKACLETSPEVETRRMFGGLAFLIRRHLICCVYDDELITRVAPAEQASALSCEYVHSMDYAGRPMAGFVVVEPAGMDSEEALDAWIEPALAFASALPPKI